MLLCSKCGDERPDPVDCYCRPCRAETMRRYRARKKAEKQARPVTAYRGPTGRADRTVVWFSAGAASAVAAKIALKDRGDVDIIYCDTGSEHPDNLRFLRDCEQWFRHPIKISRNPRWRDTWDVWETSRFLVGPEGARCTIELKKKVRHAENCDDAEQVFGYTSQERHRADRMTNTNPEIDLWCPLIDAGLTHDDTLAIIHRAQIELPVMYQLGYDHNNCIGCVKGGYGYWNKIRQDFPDSFERMARLERDIGTPVHPGTFLDELDPDRGDYGTEPKLECGVLCDTSFEALHQTGP